MMRKWAVYISVPNTAIWAVAYTYSVYPIWANQLALFLPDSWPSHHPDKTPRHLRFITVPLMIFVNTLEN